MLRRAIHAPQRMLGRVPCCLRRSFERTAQQRLCRACALAPGRYLPAVPKPRTRVRHDLDDGLHERLGIVVGACRRFPRFELCHQRRIVFRRSPQTFGQIDRRLRCEKRPHSFPFGETRRRRLLCLCAARRRRRRRFAAEAHSPIQRSRHSMFAKRGVARARTLRIAADFVREKRGPVVHAAYDVERRATVHLRNERHALLDQIAHSAGKALLAGEREQHRIIERLERCSLRLRVSVFRHAAIVGSCHGTERDPRRDCSTRGSDPAVARTLHYSLSRHSFSNALNAMMPGAYGEFCMLPPVALPSRWRRCRSAGVICDARGGIGRWTLADVFLSYVRSDYPSPAEDRCACSKQRAFPCGGITTFVSARTSPPRSNGRSADARAVVVFWSTAAHDSPWVRDEAAYARDRKKLIPVAARWRRTTARLPTDSDVEYAPRQATQRRRVLAELVAAVQRLIDPSSKFRRPSPIHRSVAHVTRRWWPALLVVAVVGVALVLFARGAWLSRESAKRCTVERRNLTTARDLREVHCGAAVHRHEREEGSGVSARTASRMRS